MIHTANTVRTLQAVALTVGLALLMWSVGLPTFFRHAEAAAITSASDTLSNSAPGVASNHTIAFTVPSGTPASSTITVTFPAEFTISGLGLNDLDITASGTDKTIATTSDVSGVWGAYFSGQVLTLTTPTDGSQSSNTPIVLEIGTNATFEGNGDQQIVNPSATTSYAILIGGSMPDSGQVRVAIIDQVLVSASVNTSLTFSVAGVVSSTTINGSPTTTSATSTPTTLPFGTVAVNTSKVMAQTLSVATNATHGYVVTVEQTGDLQSTTGATIDGFIDGAYTTTPSPWQAPAGLIADTDTYGHWGLTSTDGTTTRAAEFTSNTWVSGSTTPIVVMGHDDPADGITDGIGQATIGYQIQISALQEAGSDYSTTLRYIATPRF